MGRKFRGKKVRGRERTDSVRDSVKGKAEDENEKRERGNNG